MEMQPYTAVDPNTNSPLHYRNRATQTRPTTTATGPRRLELTGPRRLELYP